MQHHLKNASFRDVYVHTEGDATVFCYRTGMTVYEEMFRGGQYTAAGWNTSGYTQNVLESFPTRLPADAFAEPQAFDLEVEGVSLGWSWQYAGFEQSEERVEKTGAALTHAVLTLKSGLKPVTVRVHTLLDGTPILNRWLEVTNTGERPLAISQAAPMAGGIEVIDGWKDYMTGAPDQTKIYSLGYMDHAQWGFEGSFRWHDMPNAQLSFSGKYRRERHRQPFFVLRNNLTGGMMIGQLGWSGGYQFSFDLDADTAAARMAYRLALDAPRPFIILTPGECFETPAAHVGMLQGDLDDAVNAMHSHLRRSVFTTPDARGVIGWFEGGMGPERLMDMTATRHFADTIAAIGGETLIIDAGWYCPPGTAVTQWHARAGDWYPDPDRYPNGIREARDYAHQKGLLFGLWFDLERIGVQSAAAKAHPEWISQGYVQGRVTSQLNMAIPAAAAWAEAELSRCIEEYGMDLFRLDYNLGTPELLNTVDLGNGPENNYIRYYKNTNDMYRRLRQKYPDVVFENCAGGGGRTDVGFLANFTHTWISDWNVAPRSVAIVNGMTMALPPEMCDRLVGGMSCHTRGSLDFQARLTLFGRPTTNDYNAVGSLSNPDQLAFLRHTFDLYKNFIRPWAADCLTFHHTPEVMAGAGAGTAVHPTGTAVLERAAADGSRAVIGVFRLANAMDEEYTTVYPRGIDAARSFTVTLDNTGAAITMTGAQLLQQGIRVRLQGSIVSELVLLQAVD